MNEMIILSSKHLAIYQRAYALICPEIPGECPGTECFGFAPKLADFLLGMKGWMKDAPADEIEEEIRSMERADPTFNAGLQRGRVRTPDEIRTTIQALLDPHIDMWSYRLVEAQHRVMRAAAWTLDLADLLPYYRRAQTDDEIVIREWCEHNIRELGVKHILLDLLVQYDRDLDAPGLIEQIHRQLDEDCD